MLWRLGESNKRGIQQKPKWGKSETCEPLSFALITSITMSFHNFMGANNYSVFDLTWRLTDSLMRSAAIGGTHFCGARCLRGGILNSRLFNKWLHNSWNECKIWRLCQKSSSRWRNECHHYYFHFSLRFVAMRSATIYWITSVHTDKTSMMLLKYFWRVSPQF